MATKDRRCCENWSRTISCSDSLTSRNERVRAAQTSQSAVSQVFNLQGTSLSPPSRHCSRPADWKSAIQQTGKSALLWFRLRRLEDTAPYPVSYTHLRAHE